MVILNDSDNGGSLTKETMGNPVDSTTKKVPNFSHHSTKTQDPRDPICLPPGFTSEKYQEFITAAVQIVGSQNVTVITSAEQLTHEHYVDPSKAHDMHNIVEKTYFVASAVLCPREVPDVQEIMRLCNNFEMPVWPFSIGRK